MLPTETSIPESWFFLGSRDYVHGTTQSYALLDWFNKIKGESILRITASFHNFLRTQGEFVHLDESNSTALTYPTIFKLVSMGTKYVVGVKKSDIPVVRRKDFDEFGLTAKAEFNPATKSITLISDDSDYFYKLIFLTKRLHKELFTESRKWVLAKYDTKLPFNTSANQIILNIQLISQLKQDGTMSAITVNGQRFGSILFASVGK